MDKALNTKLPEVKRAEHHVFAQLLKRGVLPYRTAGGGIRVNTPKGCRLELRAVASTGNGAGEERRFAVAEFRPRPELFFLCVEFGGGKIAGAWVLPSTVFFVYSDAYGDGSFRELNLDAKQERCLEQAFREYNSFFCNRWEPVAQFDLYGRYMKPWDSPDFADGWENFEDEMMALEVIENREPKEESIPFESFVFSAATALSN